MTPGSARRHIALVGPTASGKSRLAYEVASASRHADTAPLEIVSVDSMCVYRGMDIGTAKPTPAQRSRVRHHMIDLVDPEEEYSLHLFQKEARRCLADIEARGARALLVGGTGLYVRAVVDDLQIPGQWPELSSELRSQAASQGSEALYCRLAELDPTAASRMEPTNTRRVVRALEVTLGSGRSFSSFGPGLSSYPKVPFELVGLDADDLDSRISIRLEEQMRAGFLEEVRSLAGRSLSRTAAQALGYGELIRHLAGELELDAALEEIRRRTRSFARRQRRWFRRDPRIAWFTNPRTAEGALLPAILGS